MTLTRTAFPGLCARLAIVLVFLVPFLFYFETVQSIIAIWNSSETFAHGYIILPISLWLIWRKRQTLMSMTPTPYWPALLLLALCGFGWLLAELGDVQVVRQYAFVAMIPIAALLVLGPRIAKTLAFPLFFLMLAVPFGDIFIEPLINFTADFTVWALQATGIPVLREGSSFSIPSGNWSVVEACSGVRYLISSVTLGFLYAYLTFRSRIRQAMFLLVSIVVPIAANGVRAYMIVMIGHLSGMKLAVGFDHLIYGWLFFGLVMFLMFWIGSFWREDRPQKTEHMPAPLPSSATPMSNKNILIAALSAIVLTGIWPCYAKYIHQANTNPVQADLNGLQSPWPQGLSFTDWKPSFAPANAELYRFFQHDAQAVGLSILYYRNQRHGAELISSTNRLVLRKDPVWNQIGSSMLHETIGDRDLTVHETRLQGRYGSLLVWHWYWIDGQFITNDYVGKLLQAKEKLLVKGDDSASVMVFAPYADKPDEARDALRQFLQTNLSPIAASLAGNRKQ